MRKLLVLATIGFALVGCVKNTSTMAKSTSGVEAGPGTEYVDMVSAISLFDKVCSESAPQFGGATKVLSTLPVQQHSQTGTYYHQKLNLSFKVTAGRGCSMVFVSKDEPGVLAIAFGSSLTSDGNLSVDPVTNRAKAKGPAGTEMNFITGEAEKRGAHYFVVSLASGN